MHDNPTTPQFTLSFGWENNQTGAILWFIGKEEGTKDLDQRKNDRIVNIQIIIDLVIIIHCFERTQRVINDYLKRSAVKARS